ncbi:MAG: hypothetical protein WBB68_02715 [Candidatus Moraniibacteriota bacterium]
MIETAKTQSSGMERDGDDEIGERKRVMNDTFSEKYGERIGRRIDEAVLQSEDELLEETMAIRSGDEEAIEGGPWSAAAASGAIFLIRFAADRTLLKLAFWDGTEADRAGKCAFAFAAEAVEWKK